MKSKKLRKYLLIALIALPAAFVLFSYLSALTFTSSNHVAIQWHDSLGSKPEDAAFKTSDGFTIKGWYFKKDNSNKAVVILHGWKANRMENMPRVKFLNDAGYNVLIYDARGCGESDGDMVSIGYYETEDLNGSVKFLRDKGNTNIGCIGLSQGGATIIMAAERIKPDCIIVESTYDKIEHAVNNRFQRYLKLPGEIFGFLIIKFAEIRLNMDTREMAPVDKIKNIDCPAYIISGQVDSRVLEKETIDIYNNAPKEKELWVVPEAEHEDLFKKDPGNYTKNVLSFLNKYMN